MKMSVSFTPDLAKIMAEETRAAERAVTLGVTQAGERLKSDWRAQITGAGLGTRLARTIRSARYPKYGNSIGAASLVWSKAPQIIGAHDEGALIRSKNGFWLAIPTPVARERIRRGPLDPGIWERRTGMPLRFIYRRSGPSLLVADNARFTRSGRIRGNVTRRKDGASYSRLAGRTIVPIFLLVPQVKLAKRLDLDRDTRAAVADLPGLIVANWVDGR
jgi:uncharacterized protein DUF6441